MHERTNIRLSAAERSELEAVVANRNSPQKHVWRASIVLLTADGRGTAEIMDVTSKAKTVIWRWQERFREEGAVGLWRDKTRPSRIPPLDPAVAERVVAMTLAGPPPAASHWTGSAMAKAAGISVSSVQRSTVPGAVTGLQLDLGVVDEPVKGRQEVNSRLNRDRIWNWFTDDFLTQFAAYAALLMIMTRWHVDDPVGSGAREIF
jgi:homeodomain-containing protein